MDKQPYMAFNALARRPMVFGVPLMVFVALGSGGLMITMVAGMLIGGSAWLFGLVVIAVLFFVREISAVDDRAIDTALLEIKWVAVKWLAADGGKYAGGTFPLLPMSFGRVEK